MVKTITVRQNSGDFDFKSAVQELSENDEPNNPYQNRSESEIVKMILKEPLIAEHQRICGRQKAKRVAIKL